MAPEQAGSVEDRLSAGLVEAEDLVLVEPGPVDRRGDRPAMSVAEAQALVDKQFDRLRQAELERGNEVISAENKVYGVADSTEAAEINHTPAVTQGVSRRVWGAVAGVMAFLTAGGVWAASQSKGHTESPLLPNRPSASAEPFDHAKNDARATTTVAEAKADTTTTVVRPPTTMPTTERPATTVTTLKSTVERNPAPTPISADLRAKIGHEEMLLGQVEDLKEINRFSSAHGDVVMVSVEGATPTISAKELKVIVDYLDQATTQTSADSYTVTLEDKTKLTIPYTNAYSQTSTRVFVFAAANTDLRRFDPANVPGVDGSTSYKPNTVADTIVTTLRPSGQGSLNDWIYASQEACQATLRVQLDQAFLDQLRLDKPDLARLNFANATQENINQQINNLRMALQDIKCASMAWALYSAKTNVDYTAYLARVAEMKHPLFKYDTLPYMSVTAREYANMRAALR